MSTVDQHRFLSRLRQALGHQAGIRRRWSDLTLQREPARLQALVNAISARSRKDRLGLLTTLTKRCRQSDIGIHIGDRADEVVRQIAALVQSRCGQGLREAQLVLWHHPLLEELNLTRRLPQEGVKALLYPVDVNRTAGDAAAEKLQRDRFRSRVVSAGIGITSADYCLADSATLVMTTHPGRPRAVSLIPPVHIAVITIQQILSDLQELYATLRGAQGTAREAITNCMTFVSGPSTTRDIEAVPVPGAQGPREVHIVVFSGEVI